MPRKPITLKCKQCASPFQAQNPKQACCSNACAGKAKRERFVITCSRCDKPFEVPRNRLEAVRFCSRACRRVDRVNCAACGNPFTPKPSQLARGGGKYCSLPCWRKAHTKPDEQRFWSKVDKTGDCWIWTAGKNQDGYGLFCTGPRSGMQHHPAHRYAWELTHGEITDGQWVLHRCDNPPCVNPAHLFLGNARDNVDDMHAKQRHCFGERHHSAKLTEEQIKDIRARYKPGAGNVLAREFGVALSTIMQIVKRRTWTHLE
jgi:hypothetical protein